MAKLIHIECDQVKAACAAFEKLLAKDDPNYQQELKERKQWEKEQRARRDEEFKTRQTERRAK